MDAIYGRKTSASSIEEDYAQVYNDFNIDSSKNIAKSIIIINSVDIDSAIITNNVQFEKMMFNKAEGTLVSGLPYTLSCHNPLENNESKSICPNMRGVPSDGRKDFQVVTDIDPLSKPKSILDMPLALLFPNILSENGEDISMVAIFKIVISIAFLSLKEYSENFKYSNLKWLKETDVKLQKQFLGLDLTNV